MAFRALAGGDNFRSRWLFWLSHHHVKPELAVRAEQRGEVPEEPQPDASLPEFQAAAKFRQGRKLADAFAP